jgi:hypothetical protein
MTIYMRRTAASSFGGALDRGDKARPFWSPTFFRRDFSSSEKCIEEPFVFVFVSATPPILPPWCVARLTPTERAFVELCARNH